MHPPPKGWCQRNIVLKGRVTAAGTKCVVLRPCNTSCMSGYTAMFAETLDVDLLHAINNIKKCFPLTSKDKQNLIGGRGEEVPSNN